MCGSRAWPRTAITLALACLAQTPRALAQAPSPEAPVALVPPRLLSDATVPYPPDAREDATVTFTLTIGPDGSVRGAVPLDVNEPFSSSAREAAQGWLFAPATRGGQPVVARIRVEVVFHPPEPAAPTPAAEAPRPRPAAAPPAAPQEVRVRGEHVEPSRTATLSRSEVRQIPGVFGDPFRAIEIMPGVTPIVSGLPFFFVRGAPPGDVGYFLDGVRVPYLFHVGAGPSVVHPGLMDRVDLYSGGYPARFGRYSGGIVSGETQAPATTLRGEYNVRVFDAGALVESPFAGDRGNVLLAGRYSFTAALLSLLQSSTVLDYWDYQARVGYDLGPRDRISAFAFGASDFLGQKTPTTTTTVFGANFHRADVRYDHRFGDGGTLRTAVTAGIDRTELDGGRFLRDRLVGARTEASYRASPDALVRFGTGRPGRHLRHPAEPVRPGAGGRQHRRGVPFTHRSRHGHARRRGRGGRAAPRDHARGAPRFRRLRGGHRGRPDTLIR